MYPDYSCAIVARGRKLNEFLTRRMQLMTRKPIRNPIGSNHRTAVTTRIATVLLVVAAANWATSAESAEERGPRQKEVTIARSVIGRMPDGNSIERFTLKNSSGMEVQVMTYGATLTSVRVPDRNGHFDNVTLALDTVDDYLAGHPLFGSVVGRFANRIKDATFVLDGQTHELTRNAGRNHIHGGSRGFHKLLWQPTTSIEEGSGQVSLSLVSPDGQEGYPGQLETTVTYALTGKNELVMKYLARCSKPTIVNLTNHAYWNLSGAGSGDVLGHELTIHAKRYLATDKAKVPTGKVLAVESSPLDFRRPHAVGSRIKQVPGGYDHCYVLQMKPSGKLRKAATVRDPGSGRVMEVFTTQPGVQLYTANGLSSRFKIGGVSYGKYHGLCLETQDFPDAPNHKHFPSSELRPGETYQETTAHRFSTMP